MRSLRGSTLIPTSRAQPTMRRHHRCQRPGNLSCERTRSCSASPTVSMQSALQLTQVKIQLSTRLWGHSSLFHGTQPSRRGLQNNNKKNNINRSSQQFTMPRSRHYSRSEVECCETPQRVEALLTGGWSLILNDIGALQRCSHRCKDLAVGCLCNSCMASFEKHITHRVWAISSRCWEFLFPESPSCHIPRMVNPLHNPLPMNRPAPVNKQDRAWALARAEEHEAAARWYHRLSREAMRGDMSTTYPFNFKDGPPVLLKECVVKVPDRRAGTSQGTQRTSRSLPSSQDKDQGRLPLHRNRREQGHLIIGGVRVEPLEAD